MRSGSGTGWWLFAAATAAVVLGGCASRNTAQDRLRVVEAEAIDARHQAALAQAQARDQTAIADRAASEAQVARTEAAMVRSDADRLREEVGVGRQAQQALVYAQQDQERRSAMVNQMRGQIGDLAKEVADYRAKAAPPASEPSWNRGPSAHTEAFRRDLEARLRAAGIDLPVETRITQDGQERVAVVLRGSFPPGKASPAYDMNAVKAIVGVGELIRSDYPNSRVRIEGHTDSDPIKVSDWPSNEALSEARAESVKTLFVKAGVAPGLVDTVGHGARIPLEPGNTKRAKDVNRRVEIYILPNA